MAYQAYPATSPSLIDFSNFSAVTTYASPSWTPGRFRYLDMNLYLSTTDGTTQPQVTLTGLAGYKTQITYSSAATAAGFQDNSHWNTGILTSGELTARIILTAGNKRSMLGQAFSGTTAFTISCESPDTVGTPTNLIITFASASTGRIELTGTPA